MSDNARLVIESNSDIRSDDESEISLNDSVSYECSLSDFSSDEETENLDDLCEIDTSNPPLALLRFPFTVNPTFHLNINLSNRTTIS
ncbi:piggyBac transposable element-derived protein 4 [Nephila pilipes]|uniref:PiggyBac transposable element-derived protein 4 n=1 Tax=Nephila pilipes TaxID=299642 RepID=A0A8X6QQF9_NEPPI|nr:piggyBac transposable element-derived protein 4 [Nephila pilipes]